ncbi:uncharacterized protein LOC123272646 [Cotesia glomerata]|uniref:uncharacterized protein LOC123272646 n=1 Tax=Cotesia glomerata TaxID=32391 RepID=UPI001D023B39|nr:uncharacterized protein LOC123272646 [Cotesia glomerata]
MFKKWQSLQRSYKRRQSFTQIKNETVFKNKLKELFDIAHTKAVKTLSKEGNEFLLAQRSSGRRGFIDNFPQKPLTYEELMEVDEENSDELVDNSTITPSQDSNTT